MLRWFIHPKLRAFEREHDHDASYMHEVLDTDTEAFMKFARHQRREIPEGRAG